MKFLDNLPIAPAPKSTPATWHNLRRLWPAAILLSALSLTAAKSPLAPSQEPQTAPPQPAQTAPATPSTPAQAPTAPPATTPPSNAKGGEITEDQLKQMLVGKPLFLRGGYLGDSLSFTEHGNPIGHPAVGSYTLSAVQIEKVHFTKHKVELEGARYALHFLGALPNEDPSKAVDRIKITPTKKVLRISIDREQVTKEKKSKEKEKGKAQGKKPAPGSPSSQTPKEIVASSETDAASQAQPAAATTATATQDKPAPTTTQPAPDQASAQPSDQAGSQAPGQPADQAPDQPADQASVTSTTSPAHAAKVLRDALDKVFAQGLDDNVRAQMPDFWQLYYQAQAAGVDYRPHDPNVLRASAVDQQAKLVSSIAPDSNEFAQASGIAGPALYRAVIGADGKPGEIAVERPIGFGLDENAVAAIRKATFQPALKGGQPVAEMLDLTVFFRIYSKRTSVAAAADKPAEPAKPGPYSVKQQAKQ